MDTPFFLPMSTDRKTTLPKQSPSNALKEKLFELAKENTEVFDFIFNQGSNGLLFFDINNPKAKYINEVCTKILGHTPTSLSENEDLELIDPKDEKVLLTTIKENTKESDSCKGKQLFYHQKGYKMVMTYTGSIIQDKKENNTYFLCTLEDVASSLANYKYIINGAELATWESNLVTRQVLFNHHWAAMLGYTYDELFPLTIENIRSYIHPEDLEAIQDSFNEHIEGKAPFYEFEARMKNKRGKWVWVHLKSKIVTYTPDGSPEWMSGYIEDITLKKNIFDIQNTFIAQAPRAMAMFDTNMVHLAASEKWTTDFALNKKIIGKTLYEVFPQLSDYWVEVHEKCLLGISESGDENLFIRQDGEKIWISWDIRPWYTIGNTVGGLIIYLNDITERKKTEESLIISEATFRESFHSSATGMIFVSEEGKCLKPNKAVCEILGYTVEELTNINFRDITHPEDLEIDVKYFSELINNKREYYHIEKRYIHKEGHSIWVHLSVSKVVNKRGEIIHFISQLTDITEQKTDHLEIEKTSSQLQSLMDASTHVIIFARNMEGYITVFNKGAENLLGYTKEEVILKETPDLFHHPFKDNTCSSITEAEDLKIQEEFLYFMEKEGHYTNESTFTRKDGKQFPVLLTVTIIKNSKGEKTGFLGIATDITDLKAIDKKMKSLLSITQEQNEKLKNFAQIVSHNLRSHYGNSEMLLELFQDENPSLKDDSTFSYIKETSEKLNHTISHLNDVVVINTTSAKNLTLVNVNDALKTVILNTSSMAKNANVTIENNVTSPVFVIGINAYIVSIIQSLVSNAIKFSSLKRDGFLKISHSIEGNFTCIRFEDNGLGIDLEKNSAKIFGMYKTFHRHEDSRGIGLFISRQQLEVMGGRIEVESTVNVGSVFKIFIPYE